jgi:peptide/nickel transport system permease protein
LANLTPGDPARLVFEREHGRQPGAVELKRTRHELGLDRPAPERYITWLGGAVRGDLGSSYSSGEPVLRELVVRFPATLELALAAMLVAVAMAMALGVLAAVRRNSLIDQVTRAGALLGASIPSFWLAFLLITLFSVTLRWLPSAGRGGLSHLVLPTLALALGEAAVLARLVRSSLLEVLGEDYVTTARAKGLSEAAVIGRHALRNALAAVVTQVGLLFGYLLAYSAIIEVIFVWPGVGRLAVDAIGQRDYPLIQGFVVFAGTVFVIVNLLVDLAYLRLDPRVTLGPRERPAVAR